MRAAAARCARRRRRSPSGVRARHAPALRRVYRAGAAAVQLLLSMQTHGGVANASVTIVVIQLIIAIDGPGLAAIRRPSGLAHPTAAAAAAFLFM